MITTIWNYRRPKPWRTILRPWRRDTSWALLLLEAAASSSTAQSLLWAAVPAPLPTMAILSIRSRACCLTAWRDNWRRTSPTRAESIAALDTCLLLMVGKVSSLSSRALASLWTRACTSSLASPQAPNTQPFTLPKVLSLVSTGPSCRTCCGSPCLTWGGRGVPQYSQSVCLALVWYSEVRRSARRSTALLNSLGLLPWGYRVLDADIHFNSQRALPPPPSTGTWKSGTNPCLLLPPSNLFKPSWGMQEAKRLKTSQVTGIPAQMRRRRSSNFDASCLFLQPSPAIAALTTVSPHWQTLAPFPSLSPTLEAQAGLGRQSRAAAASLNSSLPKLWSGPGRHSNHAVVCLSRSLQLHTGLALWSLRRSNTLFKRRPCTCSRCATIRCRTLPPPSWPAPSTGPVSKPSTCSSRKAAASSASLCRIAQLAFQ